MPSNRNDRGQLGSIRAEVQNVRSGKPTVSIYQDMRFYSNAKERLKPYKALPRKMRPVMGEVANYVREVMIPRAFAKEGPGWAPLSIRTQREREFLGYNAKGPILKRTGDLYAELTSKSHPRHIEVITVGKRARIEIGGSSQKFIENQMGVRELNLPQRSMIPGAGNLAMDPRDRKAIGDIIKRAMKKEIGR